MSCWREQHVLRMPATTIGIHTKEEWNSPALLSTRWTTYTIASINGMTPRKRRIVTDCVGML